MAFEINVIEDAFYTSWWIVHSEHFPVDPVNIYAECCLAGPEVPQQYIVNLFFSVGLNPTREHLTYRLFGDDAMSKEAIDSEIARLLHKVLSDNFDETIERYLHHECLLNDFS